MNRREFINITGLGLGAALLPSFPRGDILTTKQIQNWYIYVQSWKCRTRLDAEAQIQLAILAGIDTIIYSVHDGGAHYYSAFYTRSSKIEPGFDPLGFLAQRCTTLGLSLYAWICPGVDCYQFNPAWDMAGKYGIPKTDHWLDFSIPEARERVQDIAIDITSKYPVNICLDYIRWGNWSGRVLQLNPQDITTTVSMVKTAISPRLLTASVASHNYEYVLQDWFTWLRTGIVDTVQARVYAHQAGEIPSWVAKWDPDIPFEKIVPTISLYDFSIKPNLVKTIDELLIEINECKALNLNTKGLAFFDSDGINATNSHLIRYLSFAKYKYLSEISI